MCMYRTLKILTFIELQLKVLGTTRKRSAIAFRKILSRKYRLIVFVCYFTLIIGGYSIFLNGCKIQGNG